MKSVSGSQPIRHFIGLALLGALLLCGDAAATSSVNVNVTVSVVASSCTINNGEGISVEFGSSIHQADIKAGKYSVDVPYTIDCGDTQNLSFTLTMQGTAADFNSNYLATDMSGLGISLATSDNPAILNNPITFTQGNAPAIKATLVSQDNATLDTGSFQRRQP